jgi:hypothetical protein
MTQAKQTTARINAQHLGAESLRDDVMPPKSNVPVPVVQPKPDDEDWGTNIENEATTSSPESEEIPNLNRSKSMTETTLPENSTTTAVAVDTVDDYFAMLDRLEGFRSTAIASAQAKREAILKQKEEANAEFERQLAEVEKQLSRLGVNNAPKNEEPKPAERRRGRPKGRN